MIVGVMIEILLVFDFSCIQFRNSFGGIIVTMLNSKSDNSNLFTDNNYLRTVQTKASLLFPLTVNLCTNKSFCIHLHGRTQNNIWALTKQLTKQKTNCHLYRYFQTHVTWLLPFSGLLTKRKMWMSSLQSLMPIEVLALEIQEKPLHSIERTEICQTQSKLFDRSFQSRLLFTSSYTNSTSSCNFKYMYIYNNFLIKAKLCYLETKWDCLILTLRYTSIQDIQSKIL